jgi:hypothetical protein
VARNARPFRGRPSRVSPRRVTDSSTAGRVVKRQSDSKSATKSSGKLPRGARSAPIARAGRPRGAENAGRVDRSNLAGGREPSQRARQGAKRANGRQPLEDRRKRGPRERSDRDVGGRNRRAASATGERKDRSSNPRPERRGRSGRVRAAEPRGAVAAGRTRSPRGRSNDWRQSRNAQRGRPERGMSGSERGRHDWGSVARRGAARLGEQPESQTRRPRAIRRGGEEADHRGLARRPEVRARYRVVRSDEPARRRPEAQFGRSAAGGRRSRPRGRRTTANVRVEVARATPARLRATTERRLADAAGAYERDRYQDALSILRSLPQDAASIDAVRELRGLTFYRLGRWKEALRELRGFAELTGSVDQHPVIADSERALGHHDRVADIWTEIRRSGASSDVVAEGRLVMAGSLADRGKLKEAIALLGPASLNKVRKPRERHVRQWYLLGDLYERTGDVPRAREMFQRVVDADADTSDAVERLSALSAPRRRGATKHHR